MPQQPSQAQADPPRPHERATDETIKETIESIIIAFVLAFVFRAYVVEAFVIPTGSMAPTLLGNHVATQCEQCGYEFKVNIIERIDEQRRAADLGGVVCPMCNFANPVTAGRSGDRILVQKYLYGFREPQRWDVVVFKAPPHPRGPSENFIKRLVGLPEEELALADGNIYVRPLGASEWQIARKTDRPDVQRAVWQPIYHSQYVPLDGGQANPRRNAARQWSIPWTFSNQANWQLRHDGRSYHFTGGSDGLLTYEFAASRDRRFLTQHPYNQFRGTELDPIEDVRIAATIVPEASGLAVTLSTTARLDGTGPGAQPQRLSASLDAQGLLTLTAESADGTLRELDRDQVPPLPANTDTRIELWYVDQHAIVWIDDAQVLEWKFDLQPDELTGRPQPAAVPEVRIALSGPAATLHEVELDRDLYYTTHLQGTVAQGALRRGEPAVVLGADEFFCFGDNSPSSSDSRFWTHIDPLVAARMFPPGEAKYGVVPRELMMGRAFFVYFPAPYPVREGRRGIIPNFGDMRIIR